MAPSFFATTILSRRQAVALLLFTAVLWSLGGLLIKSIHWNPLAIAGARSAIAAVLLALVIRRPHFHWSGAQVGAAFAYAGTVILFVLATRLTTAANAILLQYTSPVYVALLSHWFLREKIRWIDWATIGAAFAGMGLFFLDTLSTAGFWGNAAAIASGVSFAWLILLMRKQKEGSTVESVLLGNILAAVLCSPFYFHDFPTALSDWSALLILGLVQIGLSYICYAIAIKFVTAIEASLIPVVEPILNPIWVMLFLGEQPGAWAVVGGAVVLGAVTARSLALTIRDR
ncbi:MAG: DMT family transporter [Acidobacteria bacterium]|nr:MAG: DMT family transporter [Acidobacteriota bacterium]